MLEHVNARRIQPHRRITAGVRRSIVLVKEPSFGVLTVPLRALGAMEGLKLLQDVDVRGSIDCGAPGDEVLVNRSPAIEEEAIHEFFLRLLPLGLLGWPCTLLHPLLALEINEFINNVQFN